MRLLATALLCVAPLVAQDRGEIFRAAEQGRKMDFAAAEQLEKDMARSPRDALKRLSLISFYTYAQTIEVDVAVVGRRRHLLWLAEEEPESKIWETIPYEVAIYPDGGRLRDPEGFAAIREVWLKNLAAKPRNRDLLTTTARFLEIGDRDRATELIERLNDPRHLGSYYADVLLGVTARDFRRGVALDSSAEIRNSPLWQEALAHLETSEDPSLVGSAATVLTRDGAALWASGFTEWNYSPLAAALTERIQRLDPKNIRWFSLNPELPSAGERRPVELTIGGAVMLERLVNQVIPDVPLGLRGIKGTVSLDVAVGEDGRVFKALPTGGPPQLFDICMSAIMGWAYRPTLLNGEPVIVFTKVNFIF